MSMIESRPDAPAEIGAALRRALRGVPAAVHVITVRERAGRLGMTATSVCTLSLDPPLLLACINRKAGLHASLLRRPRFAINTLTSGDREVAAQFSSTARTPERFGRGDWDEVLGAPCLASAQAAIVCERTEAHGFGTHTLLVGRVVAVRCAEAIDPLIYLDRDFRQIADGRPCA